MRCLLKESERGEGCNRSVAQCHAHAQHLLLLVHSAVLTRCVQPRGCDLPVHTDRMQRLDASAGALQRRVGEGKGRRHCIEKFRECGGRRKAHARSSNPRQIPKKRSRSEQPRCLRNPRNSGKASRRIEFNHRTRGAGDCRSRSSLEFRDRTR